MLYELDDRKPKLLDPSAWVAPSAAVIGDVEVAAQASIWFNVTARGDNDPITIGEGSNVQDNSVLHTDFGMPLIIGKGVTIGHKVMLHGCIIGDNSLIGMGSTILNGAKVGENTIVGANSLITEGKKIPSGVLVVGSPARVVRELRPEEIKMIETSKQVYIDNAKRFRSGLKEVGNT